MTASQASPGATRAGDRVSLVSIVIPMLDELGSIQACVAGFEGQTWPLDRLEVIVVDGGSSDGSREVVDELATTRPWLRVVDNPRRRISSGFNRGFEASGGDIVCFFISHAIPEADFVARAVQALDEPAVAGVGGRLEHRSTDPGGTAVGLAMTSRFGMGSPFRYGTPKGPVDTIGHPVYRRRALEQVGVFDESLGSNEDYELNWRLREHGYRLVFDPFIRSTYRPRSDLRALASQFWRYGSWKGVVVRRNPRSARFRHLVPPLFVVWLALAPVLAMRASSRLLAWMPLLAYVVTVAGASAGAVKRAGGEPVRLRVLLGAFPTMHVAYGLGFFRGALLVPRLPRASAPAEPGRGSDHESRRCSGAGGGEVAGSSPAAGSASRANPAR